MSFSRSRRACAALLAAWGLALGGCALSTDAPEAAAPEPQTPRPNVVLLSIDTLRADRLGSYGHARPTSPRLDELAAEGVRYERAYAPAPWTLPSHATMLTGIHAYDLGMRHKASAIPEPAPRLASVLAASGYRTAAWVDSSPNGYVGADRGFAEGFAEYHHAPHAENLTFKYDMAVTAERAIEWIEDVVAAPDGEPFFVFLHTKSVHAVPANSPCVDHRCLPYDKPDPYRFLFVDDDEVTATWSSPERGQGQQYLWSLNADFLDGDLDPRAYPRDEIETLEALYDAGIVYTDEHFGRVLDALERLGVYDRTLIVVTSDHGEAFLEHNLLMHQEVYEQLVHVPLIVKPPRPSGEDEAPDGVKQNGEVIERVAELSDLAPTILAAAGLTPLAAMAGEPLPLVAGQPAVQRELFAYYLFPPQFTYRAFALRDARYTLVHHNFGDVGSLEPELYAAADRAQAAPLAGAEAEAASRALLPRLRQRLATPPLYPPRLIEEDDEALAELKTLGYVD